MCIRDRGWKYEQPAREDPADHLELTEVPRHVRVYEITGPMFFGVADRIADIRTKDFTRCLILRMRGVPALDATALNALEDLAARCEKKGITLIFSHVNQQPMQVMRKAGFIRKIGQENFCPHIGDALRRAASLLPQSEKN